MPKIHFPGRGFVAVVVTILGIVLGFSPQTTLADDGVRLTAADSVRTNLWLCESLMADIADEPIPFMDPAPRAVRLVADGKVEGQKLLGQVVFEMLSQAGYEVFTDVDDTSKQAAVDYVYTYRVKQVALEYPNVGRTLGLWRQWVDRDLVVVADIEVVEADSGRLIFSEMIRRQFGDRIGSGDLGEVRSGAYSFADPETSESGWHRRLEEIVVAGTLAGMVAVYFANTGN